MADYRYEDTLMPQAVGRIYYRIKQIGSMETYNILKRHLWKFYLLFARIRKFGVLSNPAKNRNLQVDLLDNPSYQGDKISVRVIQTGKILMSRNWTDEEDLNYFLANIFYNILCDWFWWSYNGAFIRNFWKFGISDKGVHFFRGFQIESPFYLLRAIDFFYQR